ncbi:MAG: restriction endonuclease subunit S [Succinivibrio sp.]
MKQNLIYETCLNQLPYYVLGNISDVTDGIHESIDYDEDSNINLISATSPRNNYFDLSRNAHISLKQHKNNPRTALKEHDIILSTVGTIGNCAIVNKEMLPANSDRHVGIIRLKEKVLPPVLSTFLLTKYGRNQTIRESTGNVQLNLFLYKIKQIKIPHFSNEFQKEIANLFQESNKLRLHAELLYNQAEDILNKELNITNVKNSKNYSIKSLSDSFVKSKRLDAEYYQDKYDYFFKQIKSYKNGYDSVETYFDYVKTKCTQNHSSYLYIEIGDVNIGDGDAYPNLIQTEELPDNAKIMTKKGDILVSTVRPNRGAITVIDSEGILVSGAFTVLRNKNCGYLSETLQVLFRTEVYRNWLLKFNVGTSYPVIKDKDVLNMKVPIISNDIQKIISDKVRKSCKLRKQAKDLLDKSVKAVEIAIEKGEEVAMKWIIENTNEIYLEDKY